MLISVIMPVYNNYGFLERSINSILEQTVQELELIIIDDGSTQPVEEIINKFKDDRIIFLKNSKNLGTPKTLNNCLDKARGDFIARQDSDDVSLPTRFEEQLKLFKNNVGVVSTYGNAIDPKGNIKACTYLDVTVKTDPKVIKENMLERGGNYILGPSAMFSRAVFEKIGYYDEAIGCGAEDTNYWLRALQFFDLDVVKKELFYYRINPNSMRLFQKDQFGNGPQGKVARREWIFERSKTYTFIHERED